MLAKYCGCASICARKLRSDPSLRCNHNYASPRVMTRQTRTFESFRPEDHAEEEEVSLMVKVIQGIQILYLHMMQDEWGGNVVLTAVVKYFVVYDSGGLVRLDLV